VDVAEALSDLVSSRALDLPLPGSGDTTLRFAVLEEIGAHDLSLARLAEGHADAVAILSEARREPQPGTYGVWAAEPPDARIRAERRRNGWVLCGRKRYASGARSLARALVTAQAADGARLFDVDLRDPRVRPLEGTWHAVGMAATDSLEVTFDDVILDELGAIGEPGFYLSRPGFWHGAVGVAACWYGGALGAYRMLRALLRRAGPSEYQAVHLGAVAAACSTMKHALDRAACEIDADPRDTRASSQTRALTVRHVVEQGCQEVLVRVGRAGGTGPLTGDRDHARRAADLIVYLRQHHAERDLAALGRIVLEAAPCS
jgi:alkylation response protein AidB-like acyl-CoA dehydrogenase